MQTVIRTRSRADGNGDPFPTSAAVGRVHFPTNGLVVRFDERAGITWPAEPGTATPIRSAPPPALRKEVETCGLCHARRGQLAEDWTPGRPLSDTHRVPLLDRQRFHADGQMRDDEETYNYAPFKQSKMFAKGVTCSDCHDPHSAALKAPGDAVCAQCHAPAKYESAAHRHHADVSPPPGCASCHMPERRYMVVDRRHDHSFRIPWPDLGAKPPTHGRCLQGLSAPATLPASSAAARWPSSPRPTSA
jgi:predicted CXXCH cytochrome family protein